MVLQLVKYLLRNVYFFPYSTECPSGNYGMKCRERCSSHCINIETCDHVSGKCTRGCQDGYIGAHCDDSKS